MHNNVFELHFFGTSGQDYVFSIFIFLDGVEETLSENDDMEILEELLPAKNQSVFLARKLKIPDHTVDAIHKEHADQKERLYRVIQEFLKRVEPRPTWRVILDALRSRVVNLPRLAEDIEKRHGFHTPASELLHDVVLHDIVTVYICVWACDMITLYTYSTLHYDL